MDPGINERRRYPRTQVQVQAELHFAGAAGPLRCQTSDLSNGGCFVETIFAQPVGSRVNVSLWIEDRKIEAEGVVAACTPQFGVGIEFHAMPVRDQSVLSAFLQSLGAIESESAQEKDHIT